MEIISHSALANFHTDATSYSSRSDTQKRHYRRALAYVQPLIIESRVGRDKWCVGRVHFHRTRVKASAFRPVLRRPIHPGGNEGRSLEFINDSRIRLLSSLHSINTIITIRVTCVTMTEPIERNRCQLQPVDRYVNLLRAYYESTTSLLRVVDDRRIEILGEKVKRISRNEFFFFFFSLVETDLNV